MKKQENVTHGQEKNKKQPINRNRLQTKHMLELVDKEF